jgi:hypothetical protein
MPTNHISPRRDSRAPANDVPARSFSGSHHWHGAAGPDPVAPGKPGAAGSAFDDDGCEPGSFFRGALFGVLGGLVVYGIAAVFVWHLVRS